MNLTVRSSTSLQTVQVPEEAGNETKVANEVPLVKQYKYSQDGRTLVYYASNVLVAEREGLTPLKIEKPNIMDFAVSPKGQFLAVFTRIPGAPSGAQTPTSPSEAEQSTPPGSPVLSSKTEENVFIWDLNLQQMIDGYFHKNQNTWMVQWDDAETMYVRMTTNQLFLHPIANSEEKKPTLRFTREGLTSFNLSPCGSRLAIFQAQKGTNPASVSIFKLPTDYTKPSFVQVAQKSFFNSDKCDMMFDSTGSFCLAIASTEVDQSGKSYYGENILYLIVENGESFRVTDGSIHDASWIPSLQNSNGACKGDDFLVIYGHRPTKIEIFSTNGNKVHSFPSSTKNFVKINK